MPPYPWLLEHELDFGAIPGKVHAMVKLGVPYADEMDRAEAMAHEQAERIVARLVEEDPTFAGSGLENKKVIALTAYLLRLGTDIAKLPPEELPEATVAEIEH